MSGGVGAGGARNVGDVRPRCYCPICGRSIAVTFNKRSGAAYVRTHNGTDGVRCSQSTRQVNRDGLHYPESRPRPRERRR